MEALLRKHEAFEKTIAAQLSRLEDLEKFAVEIMADHHYDSGGIQARLQSVCARRDRLKEAAAARRRRLQESRQLQQFLRNMYEVRGLWMIFCSSLNFKKKVLKAILGSNACFFEAVFCLQNEYLLIQIQLQCS